MDKSAIQAQITVIRERVQYGELMEAITLLTDWVPSLGVDRYRDTALSISATKRLILDDEHNNFATPDDIAARKTRLTSQLLTLLTTIENELVDGKTNALSHENSSVQEVAASQTQGVNWKVIALVAIVLLVLGAYLIGNRGASGAQSGYSTAKDPCQTSIREAKKLMAAERYDKARTLLLHVREAVDCAAYSDETEQLLAQCVSNLNSDEFRVMEVELHATPQAYSGVCPVTVVFSGRIYTNQKEGTLNACIDFEGNVLPGTICPTTTIDANGVAEFARPYTFEADELPSGDIKAYVQIIKPKVLRADPIALQIACLQPQPTPTPPNTGNNNDPTVQPAAPTDSEKAIIDQRDNQRYAYHGAGEKIWLLRNANFATEASACLDNNCDAHGRIYPQGDLRTACPKGYMPPTVAQFKAARQSYKSFEEMAKALRVQAVGTSALASFWAYSEDDRNWQAVYFDFAKRAVRIAPAKRSDKLACRCVNQSLKIINTPQLINPQLLKKPAERIKDRLERN